MKKMCFVLLAFLGCVSMAEATGVRAVRVVAVRGGFGRAFAFNGGFGFNRNFVFNRSFGFDFNRTFVGGYGFNRGFAFAPGYGIRSVGVGYVAPLATYSPCPTAGFATYAAPLSYADCGNVGAGYGVSSLAFEVEKLRVLTEQTQQLQLQRQLLAQPQFSPMPRP